MVLLYDMKAFACLIFGNLLNELFAWQIEIVERSNYNSVLVWQLFFILLCYRTSFYAGEGSRLLREMKIQSGKAKTQEVSEGQNTDNIERYVFYFDPVDWIVNKGCSTSDMISGCKLNLQDKSHNRTFD